MTLSQIKQNLGLVNLPLRRSTVEGKPTEWLSYWDNRNRVMVVVHQDILPTVQASKNLALKTTKCASKDSGEVYMKHILIETTEAAEEVTI